jgi:AcrR family transcriptional regulator
MPVHHEDTATRERILSTAASLFASRGYHGTRLHDIATVVGIQKASLFHHFPSKADIYRAALERDVAEIG